MSRVQLSELREAIASVIALEKAYNVPALCVRLGLDEGEVSEAMSSKARYASTRLAKLPADRLLAVARALLEEADDFGLREVTDRMAERGTPPVSDLTRRRLLAVYDGSAICTEYDEIEFLERIWPISSMRGDQDARHIDDWSFRSLKDDIIQHMRRNDDWSNRELLERLGLMHSSRSLLFRFLEASVHPTTVDETTQKLRVERINAHLQHDGYRLTRTGSMSGSPVYAIAAHAIAGPPVSAQTRHIRLSALGRAHDVVATGVRGRKLTLSPFHFHRARPTGGLKLTSRAGLDLTRELLALLAELRPRHRCSRVPPRLVRASRRRCRKRTAAWATLLCHRRANGGVMLRPPSRSERSTRRAVPSRLP